MCRPLHFSPLRGGPFAGSGPRLLLSGLSVGPVLSGVLDVLYRDWARSGAGPLGSLVNHLSKLHQCFH